MINNTSVSDTSPQEILVTSEFCPLPKLKLTERLQCRTQALLIYIPARPTRRLILPYFALHLATQFVEYARFGLFRHLDGGFAVLENWLNEPEHQIHLDLGCVDDG